MCLRGYYFLFFVSLLRSCNILCVSDLLAANNTDLFIFIQIVTKENMMFGIFAAKIMSGVHRLEIHLNKSKIRYREKNGKYVADLHAKKFRIVTQKIKCRNTHT